MMKNVLNSLRTGINTVGLLCVVTAASQASSSIVYPQVAGMVEPDFRSIREPQGTARILVTVAPSGFADATAVLESTGNAELDRASLMAAAENTWRPGTLNGSPASLNAEVVYTYGGSGVLIGGTKPEDSSAFTMGDPSLPIVPAQFRQTRAPEYPQEAKRQNARGTVTVFVTVMPTGNIHDAHVALSSGNPLLDVSALRASLASRYVPPIVDGKPARQTYKVNYSFAPR